MADFPTIFDLITRAEFLRGLPAAYFLFVTTFFIIVLRHWQLSVFPIDCPVYRRRAPVC